MDTTDLSFRVEITPATVRAPNPGNLRQHPRLAQRLHQPGAIQVGGVRHRPALLLLQRRRRDVRPGRSRDFARRSPRRRRCIAR